MRCLCQPLVLYRQNQCEEILLIHDRLAAESRILSHVPWSQCSDALGILQGQQCLPSSVGEHNLTDSASKQNGYAVFMLRSVTQVFVKGLETDVTLRLSCTLVQ